MNVFQKLSKANFYTSFIFLVLSTLLFSCEDNPDNKATSFKTQLELPESLTGPKASLANAVTEKQFARGVETFASTQTSEKNDELFQCEYIGPEDDDIFKNGYNMSKFMISAVATWSCIGDSLIYISSVLPHDNKVHKTKHDGAAVDYDPEEPSHYKISDGENGKVEVALYYAYSHSEELPSDALIGFYFAWIEQGENIVGRMIIDAEATDNPADEPDDPVKVRMDFDYNAQQKKADMYMIFDEGNEWADGFRIQVIKDLTALDHEQVFTARGKIDMTTQFSPADGITEIPEFNVYTVSNAAGIGAARAEFFDLALPLGGVGNYIADKIDIYFFDEQSKWNWIDKSFSNGELRSVPTIGPILLNGVELALGLPNDYFTATCVLVSNDCTDLINAVFEEGFQDQEQNQGGDPGDWRSIGIGSASYLDSVFPDGSVNWDGVFDTVF